MTDQPRILYWDAEIIHAAAWRLCVADGYKYGRGPVERYETTIADVIMALEQGADDVRDWAEADAKAEADRPRGAHERAG